MKVLFRIQIISPVPLNGNEPADPTDDLLHNAATRGVKAMLESIEEEGFVPAIEYKIRKELEMKDIEDKVHDDQNSS